MVVSGLPAVGYGADVTPEPSELAALIADTLAMVESYRRAGGDVFPMGPVAGLGSPPAMDDAPRAMRPLPVTPQPANPTAPQARPTLARPPVTGAPVAAAPLAPVAPTAKPEPVPGAQTTAKPEPVAAPTELQGVGLFGAKWARVVEGPEVAYGALRTEIAACTACARCSSRTRVVAGEGGARALLMVVTDPPDAEADRAGTTLTGEASIMLEKMLLRVVHVDQREVQVLPVLRCAGGAPTPAEIASCLPFLERQIALTRPRAILVMGEVARVALGVPRNGSWGAVSGTPAIATFHPNHLLANPELKKDTMAHLLDLAKKVG